MLPFWSKELKLVNLVISSSLINSLINITFFVQVTQGLMAYLSRDCPELCSRGVVLGYDGRHNSCRWANLAAGVFLRLAFVRINILSLVRHFHHFNIFSVFYN